jgi:hypothetical protein
MNKRIVAALLRLYPVAWRKEYSSELSDMLLARPLTAGTLFNVAASAAWQRVRAIDTPAWVGLGLMAVTIGAIASIIVAPPPYVRSALSERIELLQKPLRSEFYVLVLFGIGFWTTVRGSQRPGRAAMQASIIASIPIALTGLLMMIGLLDYTVLVPGQTPPALDERGIFYTFYKGIQQIPGPAPLALLLSPLLRLPGAWLWGTIGGSLGQKYVSWRRRPLSA